MRRRTANGRPTATATAATSATASVATAVVCLGAGRNELAECGSFEARLHAPLRAEEAL